MTVDTLNDPAGDLRVDQIRKLYRIEHQANVLMRRRTHGGAARMFRRFDRLGELWLEYRYQLRKLDQLRAQPQAADD
jgi:hypothetical protein